MAFVGVSDPDRARVFYRDTLGLQVVSDERPFALVFDAEGTMLRVTIVKEPAAAGYTVLGWQVSDITATVKELASAGLNSNGMVAWDRTNLASGRRQVAPKWRGSKIRTATC